MSKKIKEIKERYGDLDIVDMLHQFLTEGNAEHQKQRIAEGKIGKFYPSSVGKCKRAVVYQMLGYPAKPIKGQSVLILDNGTSFHNRMEDIFERMGIMIAPELSLKDEELRISGRSDAIIWNYLKQEDEPDEEEIVLYDPNEEDKVIYKGPSNHILIVEFKSIKNKNFEKLKTKPQSKHIMQLQLYFYLTGIRRGIVWYENKNTQEIKTYMIEYDEGLIQQVKDDIQDILNHVDRHALPEKEGNALDVMCRYCDFRNLCHVPLSDEEWLDMYFEDEAS
ncbi:PD-(D/E)XK nuclease family protein [Priestia sp. YIM B13551]|uniref:CRISPR-associated protein Cas4 n=1 Tax=Priestia sp. YIM B13551 TaxID=3366306 RepID=UPI003671F60C